MIGSATAFGSQLQRCIAGLHLSDAEMEDAVAAMTGGNATTAQSAALLAALAVNGESASEIAGAVRALRALAAPFACACEPLLDVCGTGGDGCGSFNISTAVAFVVAGAGVAVAKHGNRAMSARCGSADVVEALGARVDTEAATSRRLIEASGIAFLYAQAYHPAMRNVAALRRELGVRTLFNLVGPLANPARPHRQLVGVASERAVQPVAEAMRALGLQRGAAVRGLDGLDEVSLAAPTRVVEWTGSRIIEYALTPEMLGLQRCEPAAIAGGDAAANARIIRGVLAGEPGPRRDVVLLNAALALHLAGRAGSVHEGVALARAAIDSGAAQARLEALVRGTNR
jgi:anthranilate phosphoribosyltransferase